MKSAIYFKKWSKKAEKYWTKIIDGKGAGLWLAVAS